MHLSDLGFLVFNISFPIRFPFLIPASAGLSTDSFTGCIKLCVTPLVQLCTCPDQSFRIYIKSALGRQPAVSTWTHCCGFLPSCSIRILRIYNYNLEYLFHHCVVVKTEELFQRVLVSSSEHTRPVQCETLAMTSRENLMVRCFAQRHVTSGNLIQSQDPAL